MASRKLWIGIMHPRKALLSVLRPVSSLCMRENWSDNVSRPFSVLRMRSRLRVVGYVVLGSQARRDGPAIRSGRDSFRGRWGLVFAAIAGHTRQLPV
ncbi:hypothetical protein BV20DRAFT_643774 [Pilatotrama ljubarskyi]|nr:hypothetical protein BV20DRAFT_643774 [Pilatotrama ljubarskyi]